MRQVARSSTPSAHAHRGLDRRHVAHRDDTTRRRCEPIACRTTRPARSRRRGSRRPAARTSGRRATPPTSAAGIVGRAAGRPSRRSRARSGARRPRPRSRSSRAIAAAVAARPQQRARHDARRPARPRTRARAARACSRAELARAATSTRPCKRPSRFSAVCPCRTNAITAPPSTIASRPVRQNARRRSRIGQPEALHAHHAAAAPEQLLDHDDRPAAGTAAPRDARSRRPATRTPPCAPTTPPSTSPRTSRSRGSARAGAAAGGRGRSSTASRAGARPRRRAACARTPARRTARRAAAAAVRRARSSGSRDRSSGTRSTRRRSTPNANQRITTAVHRGVERGVDERVGVGVLAPGARAADRDLVRSREQRARLGVERPQVLVLDLPLAAQLLDRRASSRPRTWTTRAQHVRAASSPAISARYSATLFVVTPMQLAHRRDEHRADRSTASNTTAPIAAGPGLPREPPSQYMSSSSTAARRHARRTANAARRHGTRIAPQLSQYATEAPAARRICSASVDGIVRWQAWHVVPTRRAAPAPLFWARRRS